ncbi:hypothetical protein [Amycolatopsis panacis]|uniref:Uncharacterized protein n=1 Tax=Amycolatopsis panacis TaxID=2340917 RepID=A0A419IAJ4_9PSEU|nr:hypothetical protein [Amycolatopsis panacis]RJQ90057.1 hypothetical protein D5S19_03630 [Amycolatopsis panacis]
MIGNGSVLVLVPRIHIRLPTFWTSPFGCGTWSASTRATEVEPKLIAGNLDVATVDQTVTDLGRTHAATLVAVLSGLRSGRFSDAVARQTATDLAARALDELRTVTDRAQTLSDESVRVAFDVLADQLAPVVAHVEASVELAGLHDDRQVH